MSQSVILWGFLHFVLSFKNSHFSLSPFPSSSSSLWLCPLTYFYVSSFFLFLPCSFAASFPGYPVVICGKHRGEGDQRVVVIQDGDPSPAKHVLIVDDLVQSGGTL